MPPQEIDREDLAFCNLFLVCKKVPPNCTIRPTNFHLGGKNVSSEASRQRQGESTPLLDAREQRLEDGASWGATARARNSEPPARARIARARRAAEGRASQPKPPLPTRATERRLEDGGQGNLFLCPLLSF